MSRAEVRASVAALARRSARRMFLDPSLSASGQMACATCHNPDHAFGPPNALAVQLGGGDMRQPGLRAVPSLRYLQAVPPFTEHFFESEDEADESVDNGPTGGLTWDGRADRGHDQARIPLLSPFEMANAQPRPRSSPRARAPATADALARDLRRRDPGRRRRGPLRRGPRRRSRSSSRTGATFYPYSSKYDAFLAGKATLDGAGARAGSTLFEDAGQGQLRQLPLQRSAANDGTPPQFTDFGLIALGVPRNPAIPANADPRYFDLGLCGPLRTDFRAARDYCGLFRTPTLRNVATRQTFFHNGVLPLRCARRSRSTPSATPTRRAGTRRTPTAPSDKFDDLPPDYRGERQHRPALRPASRASRRR